MGGNSVALARREGGQDLLWHFLVAEPVGPAGPGGLGGFWPDLLV
jgi:hypothetical protein